MSASDHLNYSQVDKYIKRANAGGGFSVKAYGPEAGKEAENMHMVGGFGRGLDIYPAEVGHDVEATTEQGMAFIETRANALRSDSKYWGGWHGGNRISQDVSAGYATTRRGEVKARRAAVRKDQEAVGTLGPLVPGQKQSYDEIDNPYYGKGTHLNTERRDWVAEPIRRRREAGPQ